MDSVHLQNNEFTFGEKYDSFGKEVKSFKQPF